MERQKDGETELDRQPARQANRQRATTETATTPWTVDSFSSLFDPVSGWPLQLQVLSRAQFLAALVLVARGKGG